VAESLCTPPLAARTALRQLPHTPAPCASLKFCVHSLSVRIDTTTPAIVRCRRHGHKRCPRRTCGKLAPRRVLRRRGCAFSDDGCGLEPGWTCSRPARGGCWTSGPAQAPPCNESAREGTMRVYAHVRACVRMRVCCINSISRPPAYSLVTCHHYLTKIRLGREPVPLVG